MNSFKVFDWKIGVMHNPGALFGTGKMRQVAKLNGFNAMVYGHTHNASVKWEGDVLLVNPGSPTNPAPPFIAKAERWLAQNYQGKDSAPNNPDIEKRLGLKSP